MSKVKLIIELDEDKHRFIQEQGYVPLLYDEAIATAVLDGKLLQTDVSVNPYDMKYIRIEKGNKQ